MTNIVNASLCRHQKYLSLDGHVFSWHAHLMNNDVYEGLTRAKRTAVNQCVEIAKTIHREMTAAQDAKATKILSDLGMTVVPVSPEHKQMFREAAQPAVREFVVGEIGEDWPNQLDAYRNQ